MSQEENQKQNDSAEKMHQEVLDRFNSMLSNADFSAHLVTLGIGRFQFSRRKTALKELRAMYVGLWKLALNRSFPDNSLDLFERFLDPGNIHSAGKKAEAEKFRELCKEYVKILEVEGDTNFINVAILLCQHLGRTGQQDLRTISLQLALDMRSMYHHIFEHLI
ncbi:MAG: hypothetical protein IJD04_04555 [Desulfovibrionaceae bacterium]|nr:hypothetical protein [Desulfovibrionaceae bacterium]